MIFTLLTFAISAFSPDGLSAPDLFSKLDKNADGKVSQSEMSGPQQPMFKRALRVADANEDGALNRDEFAKAVSDPKPVELPGANMGDRMASFDVGRLDRNTTGLLLLTNDGELAEKLTHPSNNVKKIYQAELDKPLTEEHFDAIRNGIELEDGAIKPDDLGIVTPDAHVIGIEIHSGRNRIVRRIFEHFGYEVAKLDRTTYATLTKKELPRGKWRFLEPKEVVKLKYF